MNPGGVVIALLGVLLATQVFGGGMLQRLKVLPS